ncbi:hypothetical protein glysoja_044009 [Glycine soja]|uniref:Uncharacterized protein n=1 Tax=Glycine soja TaxID=3848 RepID=A0A0B2NPK8_GLYSO|nr:hypothetical protein glysoja_044009 [Glycine soja]
MLKLLSTHLGKNMLLIAPTIHSVAYADDVVRVSVDKVINGDAEVPLSTSEIKYVSAIAPNKVTEDVQPVNDVAVDDPLDASLFVTCVYVNKIISDVQCWNIAILQLWTMYMDEWSNSLGHGSVYGFLEPQSILNAKDRCG